MTSSSAKQGVLNDSRHPALGFRPPSQRPSHRNPRTPRLVSKGRAAALPLVVSRRVWEGNRNPSQNFSSGVWGCILSIRKEYIPRCRGSSPAPPRLPTGPPGRHPQKMAVSVLRPITKKEGAGGTFLFLYWGIRPGRGAWLPRRRSGGRGRFRRPSCCASSSGGTWRRRPR